MKNFMKWRLALVFLLIPFTAMAQDQQTPDEQIPMVNPADPEIEVLDGAASAAYREPLLETVRKFWEFRILGDYATCYKMHVAAYKKEVELSGFLRRNRGKVNGVTLKSITFSGETCAFVKVHLEMQTEMMTLNELPVEQLWVWEEGEWALFDQPRKNPMGINNSDLLKPPCEIPVSPERAKLLKALEEQKSAKKKI